MIKEKFLEKAISLAKRGWGKTHPNPSVGAVLVKNGKIIGMGYHKGAGKEHAEVMAIKNSKENVRGSDLYVTLEPCSIYGKTPPCTKTLIKEGIKRVIAGTIDPNPKVNGKGFEKLRAGGIEVIENVLKEECINLDKPYFIFHTKKRPFVHLKWAQTLDGITALDEGGYISCKKTLENVHKERFLSDAILVTSGTILRDRPKLTIRYYKRKKPLLRVIIDKNGLSSLPSETLETAKDCGEIIIFRSNAFKNLKTIEAENVTTILCDVENNYKALLYEVLRYLREKMVVSLFVEAVGGLATTIIEENIVDRLTVEVSAQIVGKNFSPPPVLKPLQNRVNFFEGKIKKVGRDYIFSKELDGKCLQE